MVRHTGGTDGGLASSSAGGPRLAASPRKEFENEFSEGSGILYEKTDFKNTKSTPSNVLKEGTSSFAELRKQQNLKDLQLMNEGTVDASEYGAENGENDGIQGNTMNKSSSNSNLLIDESPLKKAVLNRRLNQRKSAIFKAGKSPKPSVVNAVLEKEPLSNGDTPTVLRENHRLGLDSPIAINGARWRSMKSPKQQHTNLAQVAAASPSPKKLDQIVQGQRRKVASNAISPKDGAKKVEKEDEAVAKMMADGNVAQKTIVPEQEEGAASSPSNLDFAALRMMAFNGGKQPTTSHQPKATNARYNNTQDDGQHDEADGEQEAPSRNSVRRTSDMFLQRRMRMLQEKEKEAATVDDRQLAGPKNDGDVDVQEDCKDDGTKNEDLEEQQMSGHEDTPEEVPEQQKDTSPSNMDFATRRMLALNRGKETENTVSSPVMSRLLRKPSQHMLKKKKQMFERSRQSFGSVAVRKDEGMPEHTQSEGEEEEVEVDDTAQNKSAQEAGTSVEDGNHEEELPLADRINSLVEKAFSEDVPQHEDDQLEADVESGFADFSSNEMGCERVEPTNTAPTDGDVFAGFQPRWSVAPTVEPNGLASNATSTEKKEELADFATTAFDERAFDEDDESVTKNELDEILDVDDAIDELYVGEEEDIPNQSECSGEVEEDLVEESICEQADVEEEDVSEDEEKDAKVKSFEDTLNDEQKVGFSEIMGSYEAELQKVEGSNKSQAAELDFLKSELTTQHDQILELLENKNKGEAKATDESQDYDSSEQILNKEIAELRIQLEASQAAVEHLEVQRDATKGNTKKLRKAKKLNMLTPKKLNKAFKFPSKRHVGHTTLIDDDEV